MNGVECPSGALLPELLLHDLTVWAASPPAEVELLPFGIGEGWHCPADATPLVEDVRGRLRCPACDRQLTRSMVHRIVETYPHPG